MKKKILALVLVGALALTGCVQNEEKAEKETMEYAKTNKEEQAVRSYEDIVANVDFTKSHIQVELKDKLVFDADTPDEVPDELGIYDYADLYEVNETNQNEVEAMLETEVVKLIDEFYGEDVTVTMDEALSGEGVETEFGIEYFSNVSCNVGRVTFTNSDTNEYDKYMCASTWEEDFSYIDSEYDTVMVEGKIEEFVKHFSSVLPKDLSDEYRCLHFDEMFWKTSGEMAANDWVIKESTDKDYYWIRMYCDVEQDICYNKGEYNVRFEKIGETSWPKAFGLPDVGGKYLSNNYLEKYVDIYLDENGEMFAFTICDYIGIGQCVEVGEVLSKQDALEQMYNLYAKHTIYEQITINEMILAYAAVPGDTVDETGYREAYLKPVWIFYLLKGEDKTQCDVVMFDGITGKLLHRSDIIRN